MSNDPQAIKAYIRLLGNPYAKEQLDFGSREGELVLREPTAQEREYARLQANQYVLLSVALGESEAVPAVANTGLPQPRARNTRSLSKADFLKEGRRIFRPYIPAAEKGRLRRHHQDFLTRNQNRSPEIRFALINELRKYDLSVHAGITAQFNRERDLLTDQKLKQVERSAIPEDER